MRHQSLLGIYDLNSKPICSKKTFSANKISQFWLGNLIICFRWYEYLLTHLFGRYNLLQFLASGNLRRHTSRAMQLGANFIHLFRPTLVRPSFSATSTSSDSNTLWTGLELSIRAICPSHRSRCICISIDVFVYIVQRLVPLYAPFSSIAERSINLKICILIPF